MRKQTDFDYRVYPVGNTEGNYNHLQLSAEIREEYLQNGWEVLSTENLQVSANVIYLAVSLVKYEDIPEDQEVKRGPGRPKKEEVVPA